MQDFAGHTAVITGAASGIGHGLVHAALARGMRVIAADIDAARLAALAQACGPDLFTKVTDVSVSQSVADLAAFATKTCGQVHLLFNNAGVLTTGKAWEQTPAEWSWLFNINVMGVVHGLHHFLPAMLAHGAPGYVVNTASMGALLPSIDLAAYTASKFAIIGLSESLNYELQAVGAQIGAAVMCPAQVRTDIMRSERLRGGDASIHRSPALREAFAAGIEQTGMPPRDLAELAFAHIQAGKFWIFSHPEMLTMVADRTDAMLAGAAREFQPMQAN